MFITKNDIDSLRALKFQLKRDWEIAKELGKDVQAKWFEDKTILLDYVIGEIVAELELQKKKKEKKKSSDMPLFDHTKK